MACPRCECFLPEVSVKSYMLLIQGTLSTKVGERVRTEYLDVIQGLVESKLPTDESCEKK